LPELPDDRRNRFTTDIGLSLYDADLLTNSKAMADYYEDCLRTESFHKLPSDRGAKEISNWLLGEVSRILNASSIEIDEFRNKVSPDRLVSLSVLTIQGTINMVTAKSVLEEMFKKGITADEVVRELGLSQISDTDSIEAEAITAIESNPQAVADYKAGKMSAIKFLVGQVMKATRGRANPQMVNELLEKKLGES